LLSVGSRDGYRPAGREDAQGKQCLVSDPTVLAQQKYNPNGGASPQEAATNTGSGIEGTGFVLASLDCLKCAANAMLVEGKT